MSFNSKGQDVNTSGESKTLTCGVHKAHVHSTKIRNSSTGKKMLEIILESPKIENFEGYPVDRENPEGLKFTGKVAWVQGTSYIDETCYSTSDLTKNEIMSRMVGIAKELGVKDHIDSINANTLEEWVEKATDIIKNEDMYFFIAGQENEYNGKVTIKKSLPKFRFCSLDETKLDKFDENNKYHLRRLPTAQTVDSFGNGNQNADFDFPVE